MIIDTTIIHNYENIQETICKFFEEGKLEKKKFYTAIGMEKQTFDRRIDNRSFSPKELLRLAEEINHFFKL
jgi:hypothetical protein